MWDFFEVGGNCVVLLVGLGSDFVSGGVERMMVRIRSSEGGFCVGKWCKCELGLMRSFVLRFFGQLVAVNTVGGR